MKPASGSHLLLAAGLSLAGCQHARHGAQPQARASTASLPADALAPSPRLIVGRIIAVDAAQGFAFVELGVDAPAAANAEGNELVTRTLDLRETGRLQVSRYLRGRTLGTRIVGGQPTPGDEVVWAAP